MLALIASAVLGLYVFFPDFVFTRITSQFVELKKYQRSKIEDIVAGLGAVAVPFIAALLASHVTWFFGHWPMPDSETVTGKWADYKTVLSASYSESYFNLHEHEFWTAVHHVLNNQIRFLYWNYAFLVLEAWGVRAATKYFGSLRTYKLYRALIGDTLLRRSSHWYVLFRAFMFPPNRKPKVMLDVMTTGNHLYDGELADYFVDSSGNLSEILLKDFRRFRFADYERARERARAEGKRAKTEDYWTTIPGSNFLIPYDRIANINIRCGFRSKWSGDFTGSGP
jgi:hypothetical protein